MERLTYRTRLCVSMRICVVAPPWLPVPPEAYGGTEAVIDVLARGLRSAGHEVLLAATGDSTCTVPKTAVLGTSLGFGHASCNLNGALQHVAESHEAAARWQADIVHDHTLFGPTMAAARGLCTVTTAHGPLTSPKLAAVYRAIGSCVPIIAISRHQARTAGVRTAAVIHHGIDVAALEPGSGDGGYALFLGRMDPIKGVARAIRVARAANRRLVIAAKMREAHEIRYFEEQIEPLLGDDVQFIGEVGGPEKDHLIGGATCLLNPIAWPEPFGMVMVESLARGTPVYATPLGAVPEIVHDGITGFVRATEDGLADALRSIRSIDRAACREAAVKRFSAERMVCDHLALYEALLGRSVHQRSL
jgi:glycosyltransferase involved in cell wall biosynthesis